MFLMRRKFHKVVFLLKMHIVSKRFYHSNVSFLIERHHSNLVKQYHSCFKADSHVDTHLPNLVAGNFCY